MKTKNQTSIKKSEDVSIQRMYALCIENGLNDEMINALGCLGLNNERLEMMSTEFQRSFFGICAYIYSEVRETIKEKRNRDTHKMASLLQMALTAPADFYSKSKDKMFMVNHFHPHNHVYSKQQSID